MIYLKIFNTQPHSTNDRDSDRIWHSLLTQTSEMYISLSERRRAESARASTPKPSQTRPTSPCSVNYPFPDRLSASRARKDIILCVVCVAIALFLVSQAFHTLAVCCFIIQCEEIRSLIFFLFLSRRLLRIISLTRSKCD